jgi:hypothetical protein
MPDVITGSEGDSAPAALRWGQIHRAKHSTRVVRFTDVAGVAVFEGDIVLGATQDLQSWLKAGRVPAVVGQGVGITGERYRWPGGKVAYQIAPGLARPERVRDAIAHWEQRTRIRFVERTGANATQHKDYVSFEDLGGCSSHVGRQGGRQPISLSPACSVGNAIHEIGHCLGLWHEQSREDRDEHVQILWQNIAEDKRHNFDQHVDDGDDLGDYDHGSIMHYGAKAFSVNGQDTIVARNGAAIGQRAALSAGDVAAIAKLYP